MSNIQKVVTLQDFFKTDFKDFSMDHTGRSIPNLVDGFKESQRKAVYGMLDRGANAGLIKVAQAAAHIAKVSDYHHGEKSMEDTLVQLAQNFPGSNNLNLFVPDGQFGSRLSHDASASRYIYTMVSECFRKIYKKDDDNILNHKYVEGEQIEPNYYLPILPMSLINGAEGIGTGYATRCLQYSPFDVIKAIKEVLATGSVKTELKPWWNGFKGESKKVDARVLSYGKFERISKTVIKITELPISYTLDKYKGILNKLEEKELIKSWDDESSEEQFSFLIKCPATTMDLPDDKLFDLLKLTDSDSENLTFWNENGKIKVFKSVNELIEYFVKFRITKYKDRKESIIASLEKDLAWYNDKIKFIKLYLTDPIKFTKFTKDENIEYMQQNGNIECDRLIKLPIYSLTKDEIQKLVTDIANIKVTIDACKAKSEMALYVEDLTELQTWLKGQKYGT